MDANVAVLCLHCCQIGMVTCPPVGVEEAPPEGADIGPVPLPGIAQDPKLGTCLIKGRVAAGFSVLQWWLRREIREHLECSHSQGMEIEVHLVLEAELRSSTQGPWSPLEHQPCGDRPVPAVPADAKDLPSTDHSLTECSLSSSQTPMSRINSEAEVDEAVAELRWTSAGGQALLHQDVPRVHIAVIDELGNPGKSRSELVNQGLSKTPCFSEPFPRFALRLAALEKSIEGLSRNVRHRKPHPPLLWGHALRGAGYEERDASNFGSRILLCLAESLKDLPFVDRIRELVLRVAVDLLDSHVAAILAPCAPNDAKGALADWRHYLEGDLADQNSGAWREFCPLLVRWCLCDNHRLNRRQLTLHRWLRILRGGPLQRLRQTARDRGTQALHCPVRRTG
mmetsp:Transcript_53618/g.115839  ORF Transcript_53618/g.115839 Transcript_53618/m.115839 type:complete len:396 (+) Transcript_53618:645-1832(+)